MWFLSAASLAGCLVPGEIILAFDFSGLGLVAVYEGRYVLLFEHIDPDQTGQSRGEEKFLRVLCDYDAWLAASRPLGDLNGDCVVDLADYQVFQANFTGPCSARKSSSVTCPS